jgi:hypothetical protein
MRIKAEQVNFALIQFIVLYYRYRAYFYDYLSQQLYIKALVVEDNKVALLTIISIFVEGLDKRIIRAGIFSDRGSSESTRQHDL